MKEQFKKDNINCHYEKVSKAGSNILNIFYLIFVLFIIHLIYYYFDFNFTEDSLEVDNKKGIIIFFSILEFLVDIFILWNLKKAGKNLKNAFMINDFNGEIALSDIPSFILNSEEITPNIKIVENKCPACNSDVSSNDKTCSSCGLSLN